MILSIKKYVLILLILSSLFDPLFAQSEDTLRVDATITELGIGYPHSFTNKTTYFEMFFNLGFQQKIGDRIFIGLLLAPQYRQNATADLAISSKFRLGSHISYTENISFDIGHSLYSRKYKSLPGWTFGFNYDKTNAYGLHLKYEECYGDIPTYERTLIAGVHFSGENTTKKGIPLIGAGLTIIGILTYLVGMSI